MLVLQFVLCGCALFISDALAEPAEPSVFDKFHQSDWKLKLEHVDLDQYDKNVFKYFKVVTFKYNRTWTVLNVTYEPKVNLNNEMEVVIQTYKFASNEYRLFPLRLQVNACFGISKNLMGTAGATKCGNFSGCPIKKNVKVHICNWSADEVMYPPFIPSGRFMIDAEFMYRSTVIALVKAYAEVYRPIPIPD